MGSAARADLRFLMEESGCAGGLLLVGEVTDVWSVEDHNPDPYPSCGVCAALVRQRDTATRNGTELTVEQCNAELRNHPHTGPPPAVTAHG
ncbi:hypothetical protein ACIQM4_15990 [Streptomyces sp. NPDC091272]|uniref:hypothetical protein n=1 Tax=Streptomyces sp. NPDC091272 TaxID=3365981 RepID=UPI0037F99BFA